MGKHITFTSTHSLPASDDVPRDIGTAEINGVDLASELLKNGWAKLKDLKRDPTDEDLRKKDLEAEARSAGKGVWNPHGPKVCLLVGVASLALCFASCRATAMQASAHFRMRH